MKRCKQCGELMDPPLKFGSYLDRLSSCLLCELYWDGKKWLSVAEAEKIAKKMDDLAHE